MLKYWMDAISLDTLQYNNIIAAYQWAVPPMSFVRHGVELSAKE